MGRPLKPRSLSPTPKTTRTRRWLPQWLLRGRPLEPRALSPKPKTTRTTRTSQTTRTTRTSRWLRRLRVRPLEPRTLSPKPKTTRTSQWPPHWLPHSPPTRHTKRKPSKTSSPTWNTIFATSPPPTTLVHAPTMALSSPASAPPPPPLTPVSVGSAFLLMLQSLQHQPLLEAVGVSKGTSRLDEYGAAAAVASGALTLLMVLAFALCGVRRRPHRRRPQALLVPVHDDDEDVEDHGMPPANALKGGNGRGKGRSKGDGRGKSQGDGRRQRPFRCRS